MDAKIKRVGLTVFLYGVFGVLLIIILSMKENFHTDEIFSYGLANHPWDEMVSMKVEMGKIYEEPKEPYLKYMTVNENHRFDYKNVWINQKHDVHPPLYYILLHTICSFFPGKFSLWFAGVINIVFAILSLYMVRKLMSILVNDISFSWVASVGFVLCSGILSSVTFLRMYVMTMFWELLLVYLFLKIVREGVTKKALIQVGTVTILSALTHYYCIIFAVFVSVVFGIYLLIKKEWKKVVDFIATMIISGGISVALFPSMVIHMFGGYRGEEAFANLKNGSDYWNRIMFFGEELSNQVFGGWLLIVVFATVMICLAYWGREEGKESGNVLVNNILMILPLVGYFLIVSKIAAFEADRYLFPIYGLAYVAFVYCAYQLLTMAFEERQKLFLLCLFLAVMCFGSYKKTEWPYLYQNTDELLKSLEEYEGKNCIFISSGGSWLHWKYREMDVYDTITFVKGDDLSKLPEYEENCTELVVVINGLNMSENYLQAVMEKYALTNYTQITGTGGGFNYYLYLE